MRLRMARSRAETAPDIRLSNLDVFNIAGHDVRALRHGLVGTTGWEVVWPWESVDAVRDAIC